MAQVLDLNSSEMVPVRAAETLGMTASAAWTPTMRRRRSRAALLVAGAVALLVGGAAWFGLRPANDAPEAAASTRPEPPKPESVSPEAAPAPLPASPSASRSSPPDHSAAPPSPRTARPIRAQKTLKPAVPASNPAKTEPKPNVYELR
jgi:hypothetical protein